MSKKPKKSKKNVESNNLCSHTAQVRTFSMGQKRIRFKKHKLRNSPAYIHSTEKELLEDWFLEKALKAKSEEKQSKFEKLADKIKNCGNSFIHLETYSGFKKYSRMFCKNEFCPTCGKNDSQLHKKRVSRAGDRLLWSPLLGYMVFTLPETISEQFPDKKILNKLAKKTWELTKKYFNTPGGMVRVHLMGEQPEKIHIHYNVLFPILQEKGVVPEETLKAIRKDWAEIINKEFNMNIETTSVYYKFAEQTGYKLHKIKYVLRPIVTPDKFLTLSDEHRLKIIDLSGWHNTRWFGKLANSQYKKYLDELGIVFEEKPERVCPIDGEKYRYVGIVSKNEILETQVRLLDNNTYVDLETYAHIKAKEKGG